MILKEVHLITTLGMNLSQTRRNKSNKWCTITVTVNGYQYLTLKYQYQYQYFSSKYQYQYQYFSSKYQYQYKYLKMVLKYRSSTSTSTHVLQPCRQALSTA